MTPGGSYLLSPCGFTRRIIFTLSLWFQFRLACCTSQRCFLLNDSYRNFMGFERHLLFIPLCTVESLQLYLAEKLAARRDSKCPESFSRFQESVFILLERNILVGGKWNPYIDLKHHKKGTVFKLGVGFLTVFLCCHLLPLKNGRMLEKGRSY